MLTEDGDVVCRDSPIQKPTQLIEMYGLLNINTSLYYQMHITYIIHSRFNQYVCRPEWTRPDRLDQTRLD